MTFTVGGFPPDVSLATVEAAFVGGIVLSALSRIVDLLPIGGRVG